MANIQTLFDDGRDSVRVILHETAHGTVAEVRDSQTTWYTTETAIDAAPEYEDESDIETRGYDAWCCAFRSQGWPVIGFPGMGIEPVNVTPEFQAAVDAILAGAR